MKRFHTLILIVSALTCSSQVSQPDLFLLAEAFHKYHAWSIPDSSILKKIEAINSRELQFEKLFISELIKTDNEILTKAYLTKPDTSSLQNIYLIRELSYNMYADDPIKHSQVIERTNLDSISYIKLLACYYDLVFGLLVNKHENLNMSGVDFDLEKLGLNTRIEKEVFFFTSFNSAVFINYVWLSLKYSNEENYKEAIIGFSRLPTYNGMQYYLFQNLEVNRFREEYTEVDELNDGYKWLTKILRSHSLLLDYQLNYLETKTLYNKK